MNWKKILHSIIAAALGGAVTSVVQAFADPSRMDIKHLGAVAGAGAFVGVAGYLKTPVPPKDQQEDKSEPTGNFPTTR